MRRSLGIRIDWTNLVEGEVYRCKLPALGEVLARLVDKKTLSFEITEGRLQSQANKKKNWRPGDTFETLPGFCDFWECQ